MRYGRKQAYLSELRAQDEATVIGMFHCKCGTSWKRDIGFFERNPDMAFVLERKKVSSKVKQLPVIRYK